VRPGALAPEEARLGATVPAMSRARANRGRLIVLTILGTIISSVLVLRRRAIAKNAAEFHQRYG